jgi:uncharacterized damage-inducible protein DinB
MKTDQIIRHLEANRLVFQSLLSEKDAEEYNFKPDPQSWSILEIVCHLLDEEREDFKTRVRNTLTTPLKQPPAIDPVGWVTSRNYAKQLYNERVEAFLTERRTSVKWLRSLDNPQWNNSFTHPVSGTMTAYSLLANWLAHDYHHIRQINRRMYEYLKEKSKSNLSYAGEW